MTKGMACPGCGRLIQGSVQVVGELQEPEVGDATICIHCRTWSFVTPYGLRHPTDEELAKLLKHSQFPVATRVLDEMHGHEVLGPVFRLERE